MKNQNKYIDELIRRFKIELEKKDRGGIYGLTQRLMAYNSNRIEGSALTVQQTADLFETGSINTDGEIVRTKDIEETNGHFLMFNKMLKTYNNILTSELIKEYHYELKSGVFEDKANGYPIGEYKNRPNVVSTVKTSLPNEVDNDIEYLLKQYNSKKQYNLEDIVKFHVQYEKIHPFQDGNGRTGRIIIFKECLKNGLIPVIIEDEFKIKYYDALRQAQENNDYNKLIKLFELEQHKYKEISEKMLGY